MHVGSGPTCKAAEALVGPAPGHTPSKSWKAVLSLLRAAERSVPDLGVYEERGSAFAPEGLVRQIHRYKEQ